MEKHSSPKELSQRLQEGLQKGLQKGLPEASLERLLHCLAATADLIANKNVPEQQCTAFKAAADNTPILLALSGGGDSTALLLALSKVAPAFGFQPIACHINHGLRASESENEAQFCIHLCEQLKVECKIIKLSALELAKTKHNHVNEDSLRQLRYSYLTKFAHSENISFALPPTLLTTR